MPYVQEDVDIPSRQLSNVFATVVQTVSKQICNAEIMPPEIEVSDIASKIKSDLVLKRYKYI